MSIAQGGQTARLACPVKAIPAPGQYILAINPTAPGENGLSLPLFQSQRDPEGFTATGLLPAAWLPGMQLQLSSPLGKGFQLPLEASRIALAALGEHPLRLQPILDWALQQGKAVVFYGSFQSTGLPPAVELYPLDALPEAYSWADHLLIDAPYEKLGDMLELWRSSPAKRPLCPTQILVAQHMPCAGMADCGVCAVPSRTHWKFTCKDGPVFNLEALL